MPIHKRANKPVAPRRKASRKITIRPYSAHLSTAPDTTPIPPKTPDKAFPAPEILRLIGGITPTQLYALPHLLTLGEFLSVERVITELPGSLTTIVLTAECREQASSQLYNMVLNYRSEYVINSRSHPPLFRYGDVAYAITSIERQLRSAEVNPFARMEVTRSASVVIDSTMIMVAEGRLGITPHDELVMRAIPGGNNNTV